MSAGCCGAPAQGPAGEDAAPVALRDLPEIRAAAVSGGLLAAGLLARRLDVERLAVALLWGALLVGGWTFVPGAVRGALRGRIGVGTLMALAAVGAVLLGELPEAAGLAFLFAVSEALEGYALARTGRGLRALLDLVPPTATVLRSGGEVRLAPEELVVGDRLLVRPGERVATDGVVRAGRSPSTCRPSRGSRCRSRPGRATRRPRLRSTAAGRWRSRSSRWWTTAAWRAWSAWWRRPKRARAGPSPSPSASPNRSSRASWSWPASSRGSAARSASRGCGSPGRSWCWLRRRRARSRSRCRSPSSAPWGAATRCGVLIKGGAALEALGRIRVVALDKTGTLTRGEPRVVEVVAAAGVDPDEVLRVAAALESRCEHPLAPAILEAAGAAGCALLAAADVVAVAGSGLTGGVDAEPVEAWELPSEPWLFTIGADGVIADRADGPLLVIPDEIARLVEAVRA